jgi:hypothetical protein
LLIILLFSFKSFSQKDSTKIYSLSEKNTTGIPTVRISYPRFLTYQKLATSSNAVAKPNFTDVMTRSVNQVTSAKVIPIGILNADINSPDNKQSKKEFILMASPLQKDIYQAEVSFQLSPQLSQNNVDNGISSIEFSFDEGISWKSYQYEEQLINHSFTTIGEQCIGFKVNSKKGTYVTYTTIDVKQLVRPSAVETKRVSALTVKGGRVTASVTGAEYRIIMGCDGIFDKPIIIAEGFDANEDVNLDALGAKYVNAMSGFTNNGYDLVLVNYDNGRTWVQDNAQVLKAVINQVNATKVGSNRLIVIGESLSGIIARIALREMEIAGQNHQVSHFVAFDTPMRGANVPIGIMYLGDWGASTFPAWFFDLIFSVPIINALDQPGAKQILSTYRNIRPNDNEFNNLQTLLNTLGYPSGFGIKNVAIINGALDGVNGGQRRYNLLRNPTREDDIGPLNQEDEILSISYWYGIYARARTHPIGLSSNYLVSSGAILGSPPRQFAVFNETLNRDRFPGGRISKNGNDGLYTSFSFVPTFSSIDYRGNLNNNGDHYFNIRNFINGATNQVTNQALTPFNAIYGDDINDQHAEPGNERDAFDRFARTELGLTNLTVCQGCTAGSGGLAGTYFDNPDLTNNANTRTSNNVVNFSSDEGRYTPFWGSGTIGNFGTFSTTNISARWEGSFDAPVSGTYNFNVRTDDGVRVWFDNNLVVNDWGNYPPKDHPFQHFYFNAGERKNIRIEWFQGGGGYTAKFLWSFNGVESFIPACRLFPTSVPITTSDCNFTVSASAFPSSVGCGGTSSLSAGCTGTGCSGVNYAWNGNGNNYSGSPTAVILPSSNGVVSYTLTGSKSGCTNQTANTSVTVSGCPGGNPTDRTEGGGASDDGANNPVNEGEANAFDNQSSTKWLIFNPTGNIAYDFINDDNYAVNSNFSK